MPPLTAKGAAVGRSLAIAGNDEDVLDSLLDAQT